jgi:hypothetical protein
MVGDARRTLLFACPRHLDKLETRAADQRGRRSDDGVVGSGKAEDAMAAGSLRRRPGRKGWRSSAVMQAQFKCGRRIIGGGGKREPAKRDKEALRGNGISNDNPDEGSAKPLGPSAKSAHARERITGASELEAVFRVTSDACA